MLKSSACKVCGHTFTYTTTGGKPRLFCDDHRGYSSAEYRRHYHLKTNYGISQSDYQRLFDLQDGQCAICGTTDPKHYGMFNVDHDHETGKVRGLLCAQCNQGLGKFRDNIHFLEQAVLYLSKHSE
jgi:hypothetical protein